MLVSTVGSRGPPLIPSIWLLGVLISALCSLRGAAVWICLLFLGLLTATGLHPSSWAELITLAGLDPLLTWQDF